jgi:outer membrane receptor protein involved in Fe transport
MHLLGASVLALLIASPSIAQNTDTGQPPVGGTPTESGGASSGAAQSAERSDSQFGDIVVTAQRQAERLQDVPIAVSAFSSETLKAQQINSSIDLQLTLPNITFTKTNFTSSSFTIRGIGDLCVGATCDTATGIHINDMPLTSTRLFETEYFDLERVEVLRGPQGTLFGRNATSGVVNFITARPNLSKFAASGSVEYGNFESIRGQGMVNLPIGETLGVRLAGYYLNRDGFTKNLFDNTRIDGRDLYAFRGTIRWEPSPDTTLDLIGYYFREKDDRSRIQKQLCNRDPTGILGCAPDRLENETTNGNATLAGILTSRQFINFALPAAVQGIFSPLALGSLYGPDTYSGFVNPAGVRNVRVDYRPTYLAEEYHAMGRLEQRLTDQLSFTLTGGYAKNKVDSTTDYNLAVQDSYANNPGLLALAGTAAAPGIAFPGGVNPFTQARAALIPNGPAGGVCQSAPTPDNGVFGGSAICGPTSTDVDRSKSSNRQFSVEGHIDSDFDGMFNFLIGGLYLDSKTRDNSYYVTSFGLDYASALLGAANALGARAAGQAVPNLFAGTPYFRSDTQLFRLKSYGVFGEAYFEFNDRAKLTIGLRYNNDRKFVRARTTLLSDTVTRIGTTPSGGILRDREGRPVVISATNTPLVPYGSSGIDAAINGAVLDFDPTRAGPQPFAEARVKFGRVTGRAVFDYKITPDNLIYASYSRGYKSGGINPPLSPSFEVPVTFRPESVDSFEIGSKNTFADGKLRLNVTAFYYKYKDLQLSRIVARTSVNDNIDANIWGLEAEAIIRPGPGWLVNLNASYLKTEVARDTFLANPQDPSGYRSDAVIIKDITNAANCAVRPAAGTSATAAAVNAFVNTVNTGALGLQPAVAVPGTTTTGAYSVCGVLAAAAAGNAAAFNPALGALQPALNFLFNGGQAGALPFVVDSGGVLVNVKGNKLPQAPEVKFSAGVQYTADLGGDLTLVPRADLTYTGEYYGSIFNRQINRIQGFAVINAQVQLNGPDERWFVRGFVQNLTKNNAITGQYVTDQSSGNFTNIFTLEPRRYGIAAGFRF